MDRMQRFVQLRVKDAPGIVDAERLVEGGDISGAGAIIDSVCDRDQRNAKSVRDRFALYIYQKGIEAAAKQKKDERYNKREQALLAWKNLFKDVDVI